MTASISSRASSIVLTSRATDVRRSMPRSVVCSSVVLPDPISPGDDDESGASFDAVAQVAQRLGVHPARIEIVRIRAQIERSFAQVVETFIHGERASQLARRRRSACLFRVGVDIADVGDRRQHVAAGAPVVFGEVDFDPRESRESRRREAAGGARTSQTRAAAIDARRRRRRRPRRAPRRARSRLPRRTSRCRRSRRRCRPASSVFAIVGHAPRAHADLHLFVGVVARRACAAISSASSSRDVSRSHSS